jgi:anthranilate phosphoribosyltransferase
LLAGKERGPKRQAVLLNTAAALVVADRTRSFIDGWTIAEELIDSGKAADKLRQLIAARPA